MAQQNNNACIVCGPSGVGKGTLLKKTRDCFSNTFGVAVSHTTRKPRPGEVNGVDYNFTTRQEFEKGIQNNEFVEYADVNGNFYGTSIEAIKDVQKKNLVCILEIDVQGAKIIKDSGKVNANYLFITCDGGIDTLKKRLMGRNTETQEQMAKRLNTAEKELTFLSENDTFFEHVISNDDLQQSTQRLIKHFKAWYPWIIKNELKDETNEDNDRLTIESCPIVVCGPSGVGKGTLLRRVKELLPDTFGVACSHTTRKPRHNEVDGIHYNFTTKEEFKKGIENDEFVEYADVNGNYYGTSYKGIDDESRKNLICILEIDVQGAKIIQDSNKINANYLFITCDGGIDTLKKRLKGRNTESDEQIEKRMKTAEKEMVFLDSNEGFFNCVVSNDDLEESAQKLVQTLKEWYPWIITDNLQAIDDEKESRLVIERQSVDGLFNALQFDGASVYDIRSKGDYDALHAFGAIHISNVNKLTKQRIFVYGDALETENNKRNIKRLYEIAIKSNVIQFCIISDGFDSFKKEYSFLCIDNNRTSYPNCVGNTNHRLYIGGSMHAFDANVINKLGITHIVNTKGTQSKLDENIAKRIKYLNIKIDDSLDQSVFQLFDKTSDFVHNALEDNDINRVLIHCGKGKSRSATFIIAYLMKYRKQTLAFAYGTVSIARPKAFPNNGFIDELAKYEAKIYDKSTKHFIVNSKLRDKTRWKKVLDSWRIEL